MKPKKSVEKILCTLLVLLCVLVVFGCVCWSLCVSRELSIFVCGALCGEIMENEEGEGVFGFDFLEEEEEKKEKKKEKEEKGGEEEQDIFFITSKKDKVRLSKATRAVWSVCFLFLFPFFSDIFSDIFCFRKLLFQRIPLRVISLSFSFSFSFSFLFLFLLSKNISHLKNRQMEML